MASNDFWELVEKKKKKKKSSKNGTTATVPNNKTTASKRGGSDNTGDFWSKVDKYKQDKTTATIPERKNLVDAREDIAPVKKQEDDGKLLEFFQKSSLFEDGYDRGDVAKTILATGADIDIGIFKGVARVGENIGKLAGYGIAGAADLMGKDKYADEVRERAKTNYVDLLTGKLDSHLDKYSVLGRTSDAVMEGLGQIGVTVATSGLGAAAGMSSAGVTALNSSLMFAQGMGGGMNEAYLEGATDGEALAYGALAGTADALSEMLFAGLGKGAKATGAGFGLSGLDDMLAKKASNLFKSQIAKNLVQYGIKASAEGFEEVLAGVAQGIAKRITYLRDEVERGETNLWQILKDENLLEQFVVGSVISGFAQSGDLINSIQTKTDFVSGMTKNEQAVVDHEYKKRLEKETQNGKKISGREKSKIYDRVVSEMEKGYLSTDTIEEVLGGETYKEYKGVVDNENNLKKEVDELIKESDKYEDIPTNQLTGRQQMRRDYLRDLIPELQNQIRNNENSTTKKDLKSKLDNEVMNMVRGDRLSESYAEKERVYQKLDIDPETFSKAKHADAAKQTVASAVELGANNTNRVRDLVEHAAQISGKTGKAFFFKDNDTIKNSFIERQTKAIEKLEQIENRDAKQNKLLDAMKQKLEDVKSGKIIVNGENSADGIVLNIDSKNPLMVTVGHEVTHDTENVKHYDKMKKALFAYASTKGIDVETRIAMAKAEYEGIADADAEHEVVADLAGEMLFTDDAFVDHLARTDTNVFQSLWNDIKNLVKMATPGSKEAKELANLEHKFEKAFREANKAQKNTTEDGGGKYSLVGRTADGLGIYKTNYPPNTPKAKKQADLIELVQNTWSNKPITLTIIEDGKYVDITAKFNPELTGRSDLSKIAYGNRKGNATEKRMTLDLASDLYQIAQESRFTFSKDATPKPGNPAHDGVTKYHYFLTNLVYKDNDGNYIPCHMNIDVKRNSEGDWFYSFAIEKGSVPQTLLAAVTENSATLPKDIVTAEEPAVKEQFSLSSTETTEDIDDLELFLDDSDIDWDEILGTKWLTETKTEDIAPVKAEQKKEENWLPTTKAGIKQMYNEAIDRGDIAKAQKIVDEVAKLAGFTQKGYHGTDANFNAFSESEISARNVWGKGFYFGTVKSIADDYRTGDGRVISAYLKMENPFIPRESSLGTAEEILDRWFPDMWQNNKQLGIGYINGKLQNDPHDLLQFIADHNGIEIRDVLTEYGYDSIKSYGELVVFSPEQIKSSDPITFDDDGNWINIDERFNPETDDIRYSLTDTQASDAQPVGTGLTGRDILTKQAPANYDVMGATPETNIESRIRPNVVDEEAPVAPMPVETAPVAPMDYIAPVAENATTEDIAPMPAVDTRREVYAEPDDIAPIDGKRRKWIGTSTESEVVDGQILPDDLDQELIHYHPISNKKTLGNANSMLDSMGYESSVSYMNQRFASSKVSLDDIALGERLIQEAVKRGDTETAKDLIMDISILGTELGQKVQALSIIKRLTPEGQLKMLMRTVERGKAKNDKAFEGVEVTNEMAKEILDTRNADGTYDQDKLNTAVENVKQKIAKEMKSTILERINEWRYLSMLGNPKTHIRNLVSNVAMYGTRQLKNAIARTGETLAGKKIERTKTWQRASKEVRDFANQVASQEYGTEKTSKYSEAGDLKSRRQVLKIKALDVASKANSAALSAEDTWFSKPAYRQALQEYLTANGIRTEEDIHKNGKLIAKAKQYAKLQAQEATFQQDSYIANKIAEIERKNAVTNVLIGSVMPFKKTPINIAKAGLSYSPLGFARNVYDAIKVSKGEMNASTAIDHFAQTLTGTSLAVLGYVLASRGILNGAGKDDKEGKYDYQLGKQSYSFNFDGDSFSLSWLSPVAMPLFVGANAYEILVEDKDWDYNVLGEALAQTLDPMNEMSFLSSLTDVLSSYDSGMAAFGGMLESAAQSYITSFVPTLFSQIAQVTDDKKRSTKIDANSGQDFLDETWNQIKYKIPGLRQTLEPSTDIWGNEIPLSENAVTKALETFILPYSRKDNIATKVDEEIKNIYRLTGENGVIPNVPYNYINYKNEKYEMTAAEHTEYKKVYGQTSYQLMEDLIYNDTYQRASAEEKAKMMDEVFNYARDKANQGFLAGRGVDYFNTTKDNVPTYKDNAILGAIENDMTIDEYKTYRDNPEMYAIADAIGGFKVYENYKKATNGMKLAEKADYIGKMNGLSTEQKNLLVNSETDREEPIDLTGYENYDSFEEFEFAKNYPKKYSVAKVVADNFSTYVGIEDEITRIKTDNPSSSGVKDKDLVKEYIFSLDLDEGQKALLYRSMYSSKSDKSKYNRQIVEYLDNRDDISWEEMKEILIGLDFTITDGNRIKW